MNPYVIAGLVILGAIAAAVGNDLAQGVRDGYILFGDALIALGTAIAGLMVRLPQKPWSAEERAAKLETKSTVP